MLRELAVTRRTALSGAGAAAGAVVLAACSSGTGSPSTTGAASAPADTSPAASAPGAEPLAQLADIPVGSAVSAKAPDGRPIVVAQPQAGTAVAFSAICTHQGCTVAPAGSRLECPCHGSVFEAATGRVVHGPAPRPLNSVPVHVDGGAVLPGSA